MIHYRIVCALQDSLSEVERKKIRSYVACNDKLCGFIEILRRRDSIGFSGILIALYGDERKAARDSFRKLCEKYIAIFLYVITNTDTNEWNQFSFQKAALASAAIKKQILFVQVLEQRGAPHDWLLESVKRMALLCREFGLIEDLVVVLMHEYHLLLRASRYQQAEIVLRQHALVLDTIRFQMEMEHFLFDYLIYSKSGFEHDPAKIIILERKAIDCSLIYQKTGLVFLFFFQLIIQTRIMYARWDLDTAHKLLLELNILMRNHSEIEYRLATGSMGVLKGADSHSDLTRFYFSEELVNTDLFRFPDLYAFIIEPLVYEYFYSCRYEEARQILIELMRANPSFQSAKNASRIYLLMAYIHLMLNDKNGLSDYANKATRTLNNHFEWMIAFRLLQIYSMIQFKEWTFARLRIDSLRKFLERNVNRIELRKRDITIFRLLMSLSRADFDFSKVSGNHKVELDLLKSGDPQYRWIPGSFEFIVFDKWMDANTSGEIYRFDTMKK